MIRILHGFVLLAASAAIALEAPPQPSASPEPAASKESAPEQAPAGKSVLVVAGMNYENLSLMPFFIDPVLRKDLEGAGLAVGECRWSELTWEKLKQFDAAIFLQTPNLPSGELENGAVFARMRDLTKRFLEAGGGVLVFPDLFRGRIEPTINRLLQPYEIEVTSDQLQVPPGQLRPFNAYPALGRSLTTQAGVHAVTQGVGKVWLPIGNELGFALKPGAAWTVLLRGPEGSWAGSSAAAGQGAEPPVVAACRDVGPGRLAVFASHSSFWVLNPFHEFWDNGAILREDDGRAFLDGLLGWLVAAPSSSGLGGFQASAQAALDSRGDRRESAPRQKASFPATARRGVIGAAPGASASQVASLSDAARKLGLDFVVFTPEASMVEKDADWNAFVGECRKASEGNFVAIPGVSFRSSETGNTGVAFNLKKRWPQTPWRGEGFETFVRIGVNNDWESVVALVAPSKAPFPYANLGAFTAMAVSSWDAASSSRLDGGTLLREALSGGWKLMPMTYHPACTAEELAEAARHPTTLYTGRWPEREGAHSRWDMASVGEGRIKHFSVEAGNTWEPAGYSAASAKAAVEGLPDGAMLELYCWHRLLRRAPVAQGIAETSWEGVLPGAGMFWLQAVDAGGNTIMQASPLAVAKITFSAFIGTDMMNGYWYPAKKTGSGGKNAVLLGGAYGQLGTSVYPQLGWGGHWQFRTLNQIGEPLGFEIGSPPGGLPRMTAGYRWPQGTSLSELAPMRTMGVNSTQAVVWNDRDTVMRKDTQFAGRRKLSVAPFPGVSANTMRTTGYRWWDHAVLHFEADASVVPSGPAAGAEANLAAALLGDPIDERGSLNVLHDGAESVHALDETIALPRGAGATLGDRPMGMVSLWSLADDILLRITRDGNKPVLSLSQPGKPDAAQRSASFLLVISAHHADRATALPGVRAWLFDNAVWAKADGQGMEFSENVDLGATRGERGAWKGAGKKWRGRITGLDPAWDAAVLWREADKLTWLMIPWSEPDGPAPVLMDSVPEGRAFIGHPITASKPGFVINVVPAERAGEAWKIVAHNTSKTPQSVDLRTHASLEGLVAPWNVSADFAPGETKSWTFHP